MDQTILALLAALALAAVHLLSGRLRALGGVPRSRWLSAFGGISVAYVFVHLLPELAAGQEAIEGRGEGGAEGEAAGPVLGFLEHHVWMIALAGLVVFYAVERHSTVSREARRARHGVDRTHDDAFWLSMASFTVYNAVIGYVLLRGELDEPWQLAVFAFALGVHFVVNDFGLREHHKDAYERVGRWLLAGAVLLGWLVGTLTEVPERAIVVVVAFIAGGVVLNVMKEEVPSQRQARLLPFVAGAVGFTVLLQLT